MIWRSLAGVALILLSIPATLVGLDATEPWTAAGDDLEVLAAIGPLGIGLGIAVLAAAKAPPGRFVARVGAHVLLLLGLVLATITVLAMNAYYGGPCIAAILAPFALATIAAGALATRATWVKPKH